MSELRRKILDNYRAGQGQTSSGSIYADLYSPWPYYEANYKRFLGTSLGQKSVLEIGCGHGSLLAWFKSLGASEVEGVDESIGDVSFANVHLGENVVKQGDATEFLRDRRERYDLIVLKALLEHVPKDSLIPFLTAIRSSLRPEGTVLIDVPNMDWLLASHERYMDLTHEVGFTTQSLSSLLGLFFSSVDMVGSVPGNLTRSQRVLRGPLVKIIRKILYLLGEGASDVLFESRSLIAHCSV